MNKYADLHLHSKFSDGSFSPKELVELGASLGFSALSITDHDCTSGITEALAIGKALNVEVIPGVEMSTMWNNKEIHILGYYINHEHSYLQQQLTIFSEERKNRVDLMINKLNHLGVYIELEEVLTLSGEGCVGRPHVAKAIVDKGYALSMEQAFANYLQPHSLAYVPRYYISPEDSIQLIKGAGGIAVLAHPGIYQNENIISSLATKIDGVEVWHCKHSTKAAKKFLSLADKFQLLVTGGSDWHGPMKNSTCTIGSIHLDYDHVEKLKERKLTI